jgi:8-oxo-dGTP pyrophosphatase MutT (NUDIX family)
MEIDYPGPEGILHSGPETLPRVAATVILLRGGSERLEVLLVRRDPAARFMGGVWVFPGGSVDPNDGGHDEQQAIRAAATRELSEEAGIELDSAVELVPFARWITPAELRVRFDTWFFLALAPADADPVVDGAEVVDFRWCSPAGALEAGQRGELELVFPTIKQLERLARFGSADDLLADTREREIVPIQPRVVVSDGRPRLVIDGQFENDAA